MKLLAITLLATAAATAVTQDQEILDEYVDLMMRQSTGEEDTEETDLDEAIQVFATCVFDVKNLCVGIGS